MNTFNQLLRKGFFESPLLLTMRKPRPKVSPKTIAKRKELKRSRLTNKFSSEVTGEKPVHVWMDPKKVKAMGLALQEMSNHHRLSRKIDIKDIPELKEKGEKFAELNYHAWRSTLLLAEKQLIGKYEAENEAKKLPFYLREELEYFYKSPKIYFRIPEEHNFYHLYYEQLMRIFPDEQAERLQISLRLLAVATDTLGIEIQMIGAPVHRFMRNPNYASSIYNRVMNRASCFDNTLSVLEDPKNQRKLFLIGTSNSSTMLAQRTRDLIRKERPDSLYVMTNQKWWNVASQIKDVSTQQELNLYTEALKATQDWVSEWGLRGLIFKARFYPWLFLMSHLVGFPDDFNPFTPGLEMKYAIEEAHKFDAKIIFGGQEIDASTFQAFRVEKRMDIIPLYYRWFKAFQNSRWKSEHRDNYRLLAVLGGEAYAEVLDKYRLNWFIKLFDLYAPLQKKILIDQRDTDIFYSLYRNCPGKKIVAVVNHWHLPGVEAHWRHTTGTEIRGEPINPIGDFDIEKLAELDLVNQALREFTSKMTKSEPADTENYMLNYHKKNMEAERSRSVHFLGHDDPNMPGEFGVKKSHH